MLRRYTCFAKHPRFLSAAAFLAAIGIIAAGPSYAQTSSQIQAGDLESSPAEQSPNKNESQITAKLLGVRRMKVMSEDEAGNRSLKVQYFVKHFSDDSLVRHGEYIEFYPSGSEFCRGEYADGRRKGTWTFLHKNGKIAKQGDYLNDGPTGKWMVFNDREKPVREENYDKGLPHGIWMVWFANGNKQRQMSYKMGRQHGRFILWDEQGNMVKEMNFTDGKPTS